MTSVPRVSWLPSTKRPSLFVRACASCLGSPALAAQRVTLEFARGPPPAWTCPSIRTPNRCCANPSVLAAITAPNATSAQNKIGLAMLMVCSTQCHPDEGQQFGPSTNRSLGPGQSRVTELYRGSRSIGTKNVDPLQV